MVVPFNNIRAKRVLGPESGISLKASPKKNFPVPSSRGPDDLHADRKVGIPLEASSKKNLPVPFQDNHTFSKTAAPPQDRLKQLAKRRQGLGKSPIQTF